jgi:XTP/dITP diphosphohydrolase
MAQFHVVYVTSSDYKIEENQIFTRSVRLDDGVLVGDVCRFDVRQVPIKEVLEVDLPTMVLAEASSAYSQVKVPCVVEHAGLIFEGYNSYPGGLTKPMWNVLGDAFVAETRSQGRRAVARAVVAYCDGQTIKTFVGETEGRIADAPRGDRAFYWDTVFIPNNPDGTHGERTYAEIVAEPAGGLEHKVVQLSQSTKAMRMFVEYRRREGPPRLWGRDG